MAKFAQAIAAGDDKLAGVQARIRSLRHSAHDIDAGDEGIDAHDPFIALQGHGVLVIEGRKLHIHDRVAFPEQGLFLEGMGYSGIRAGDNECAHGHYRTEDVKQRFLAFASAGFQRT